MPRSTRAATAFVGAGVERACTGLQITASCNFHRHTAGEAQSAGLVNRDGNALNTQVFQTDFCNAFRQRFNEPEAAVFNEIKDFKFDSFVIHRVIHRITLTRRPQVGFQHNVDDRRLLSLPLPGINADNAAQCQVSDVNRIHFKFPC